MRFMYVLVAEKPMMPNPALREAIQKMAEREVQAGRMLDTGALLPRTAGAEVRIKDGKLSVIDGPFLETKEVVGGYAVFELKDKEEAVARAVEFMQLHIDHQPDWDLSCEVRPFIGP
ncbi:DGPFAETKE domain-containing protein [Bradyrhizobium sp. LTSP885]|uniref:YciI family protein n=2 Tax=unclassified Bradyrhizobium TaxID=2631580 RepID=UPI0005CAE1DA|nr:YciI family protein [Bradyrhizobium sp. LTSP885]KJC47777.1 DGPFAETKE domain-containing protein [Bradyrhizobium sp. LTSP885]